MRENVPQGRRKIAEAEASLSAASEVGSLAQVPEILISALWAAGLTRFRTSDRQPKNHHVCP